MLFVLILIPHKKYRNTIMISLDDLLSASAAEHATMRHVVIASVALPRKQ